MPVQFLPRELVVATGNRKKGVEMATILAPLGLAIRTLADFPGVPTEVDETGITYAENAELKARAAAEATGRVAIADDAGLEIDALDGQPGLYSRRFLGEDTPFPEKMARLIEMLQDVPDEKRGCRFRCSVVIAVPGGASHFCAGVCEGRIAHEMRGHYGFGYDPIFYLPDRGCHMAELPPEEKHRISHRGQALARAAEVLRELIGPE